MGEKKNATETTRSGTALQRHCRRWRRDADARYGRRDADSAAARADRPRDSLPYPTAPDHQL